jgi:myo-inositol 2-dehydrogenase / D-chiro-inositol 1-dehydrogenase
VAQSRGVQQDTVRGDSELFHDAYTAELAAFIAAVRYGSKPEVTGDDARAALVVSLACIESVRSRRPVQLSEVDPK